MLLPLSSGCLSALSLRHSTRLLPCVQTEMDCDSRRCMGSAWSQTCAHPPIAPQGGQEMSPVRRWPEELCREHMYHCNVLWRATLPRVLIRGQAFGELLCFSPNSTLCQVRALLQHGYKGGCSRPLCVYVCVCVHVLAGGYASHCLITVRHFMCGEIETFNYKKIIIIMHVKRLILTNCWILCCCMCVFCIILNTYPFPRTQNPLFLNTYSFSVHSLLVLWQSVQTGLYRCLGDDRVRS